MSKGDGKNPKFRILCKRCNSYQHIVFMGNEAGYAIMCTRCGNAANDFNEEADNE